MESPPKRVTRARAAAKKDDSAVKTTKIATASSRAKAAPRVTATTKRKTRADEERDDEDELSHDHEQLIEPDPIPAKSTRGRQKKTAVVQQDDEDMMDAPPVRATRGRSATVEPEQMEEVPVKATRGRPRKIIVDTPAEQVKTTRTRAKKIEVPTEESAVVEEPKRATRGRAITITKPTAPKKSVKFEEPDKENVIPITAPKDKQKTADTTTGLRAKPVRKPAVPTRATRGRPKADEKKDETSPLSPKKITQVGATTKDSQSEDELATMEKTPMKPLMRSPVKPSGSIFGTAKKLDFSVSSSITVNRMTTQDLGGSIMASPARRPTQSPFKETFRTSPQRSTLQSSMQSPFKPSLQAPQQKSSFKSSLLSSPARRPVPASPTKVNEAGSPTRNHTTSLFGTAFKATPFKISRFTTPRTLNLKHSNRPGHMVPPPSAPPKFATGSPKASLQDEEHSITIEPKLKFSGRLSSIMPRSADPALNPPSTPIREEAEEQREEADPAIYVDHIDAVIVEASQELEPTTPLSTPPRNSTGGTLEDHLRDESPFNDSDSEDELASASPKYSPMQLKNFELSAHDFASSPIPFESISTPKPVQSTRPFLAPVRLESNDKVGFTPLAAKLSNWMAPSPEKPESTAQETDSAIMEIPTLESTIIEPVAELSPAKSHFFDDQMDILEEMAENPEVVSEIDQDFGLVELDEEDLALAEEADEMSLLDPEQLQMPDIDEDMFAVAVAEPEIVDNKEANEGIHGINFAQIANTGDVEQFEAPEPSEPKLQLEQSLKESEIEQSAIDETTPYMQQSFEQALSEASQEYGDENSLPVESAPIALPAVPEAPSYHTPKQILRERTFHTVSKVPLKPAAEHTPIRPSPLKRSASSSRIPPQRPANNLTRKNTVISYSPTKSTPRAKTPNSDNATPKVEWSTVGTPARTPRRDLNGGLLKGAVVFVDVHTTEGADASVLFTELLTQMGARCVKTWNWNANDEGSKIGITHVVFKDGGKRTIEKVRETNGVVACVGVGWVLDCERENQWLPESPYAIDTALVPRGGHRRRKSMEPKALANLNGTLVPSSTPSRASSYSLSTANTPLTSKSRRRDSVQWVRSSPASESSDAKVTDEEDFLSPVPATPGIGMYSDEGLEGLETPGAQTPYFLKKGELMQQTAPVRRFADEADGEGDRDSWLNEKKDESVMMRLMAARRKSLQWAPKIGSPLAR